MATSFVRCDNCKHKTSFANMTASEGNGKTVKCRGCGASMIMRMLFPNELRGCTAVRDQVAA